MSTQSAQPQMPREVKALLLEAWNKELWIHDQLTGTWYTPEEFKAEWHKHVTSYNLHRYIAESPKQAVAASLQGVKRTLEQAEALQAKIDAYYATRLERKK